MTCKLNKAEEVVEATLWDRVWSWRG